MQRWKTNNQKLQLRKKYKFKAKAFVFFFPFLQMSVMDCSDLSRVFLNEVERIETRYFAHYLLLATSWPSSYCWTWIHLCTGFTLCHLEIVLCFHSGAEVKTMVTYMKIIVLVINLGEYVHINVSLEKN